MSPLIVEQIINNSDNQILDLQDQLVDSRIVSEYSYGIIDSFENQLYDNRTISPNWPLSSLTPGLIGTTTISLTHLQSLFNDQDINFYNDFNQTFWSKYEPTDETRDISGIVLDGKTHLDSVAEAVFNAVLGALESFVKAVKELASKIFDWIYKVIKSMLDIALAPINNALNTLVNNAGLFIIEFVNELNAPTGRQSDDSNNLRAAGRFFLGMITLIMILSSLFISITVMNAISTATGMGVPLSKALTLFIKPIIRAALGYIGALILPQTLMASIYDTQISDPDLKLFSALMGFAGWGLGLILFILKIAKYLKDFKNSDSKMMKFKNILNILGVSFAIIGFLLSLKVPFELFTNTKTTGQDLMWYDIFVLIIGTTGVIMFFASQKSPQVKLMNLVADITYAVEIFSVLMGIFGPISKMLYNNLNKNYN